MTNQERDKLRQLCVYNKIRGNDLLNSVKVSEVLDLLDALEEQEFWEAEVTVWKELAKEAEEERDLYKKRANEAEASLEVWAPAIDLRNSIIEKLEVERNELLDNLDSVKGEFRLLMDIFLQTESEKEQWRMLSHQNQKTSKLLLEENDKLEKQIKELKEKLYLTKMVL